MDYDGPITLLQAACGEAYVAMLIAKLEAHRDFCAWNRVQMVDNFGIRRGVHPWQASFNRIEMLNDMVRNYRGWAMYLDADAVIRQPDFDMRRYLGKRSEYAMIACPGSPGAEDWDINSGVLFINFGHDLGREIVDRWHTAFHAHVSLEALEAAVEPFSLPTDDQHLLQMELLRDVGLRKAVLLEDPMLINHRGARFIRQFMRSHGSLEERLQWVRDTVAGLA